ncbi:SAM-dependent methyltransferase [Streptomyces sp. HNM0575]|uniref:SAM-dependent methyltransferase n=1 Tax=Streptomyces sp. HNM0575 TaxID=2716338 RepID=UPI00145F0F06|nr:SAM-dependent methyltransferase [Streptomyces sp. HNM0575]NLU76462.1 SAM-dependent methyltransferase [Streptomyces sp. HNM0575]
MADDESQPDPQPKIDTSVPHSARIWNYWLGGKDNYPVDAEAGDEFAKTFPGIVDAARGSRYFLARAVRHLAGHAGIRQFLDVGTGLPTVDNTHEIAQSVAPDSRIVYVDNDPLVLVHAQALLTSTPEGVTDYIDADVREPDTIIEAAARTLDFDRPVGLMMLGIMGHITDDELARSLVGRLLDALPPGSHLTLSDGTDVSAARQAAHEKYNSSGAVPYHLRSPEELGHFFDGLDLLEPGLVPVTQWRPDHTPFPVTPVTTYGGVGRKP